MARGLSNHETPVFILQGSLTHLQQIEVAKYLSTEMKIQEVGARLNVPQHEIQAILNSKDDLNAAALGVLGVWRDTVETGEEAYGLLRQALVDSGLQRVAVQVFGE